MKILIFLIAFISYNTYGQLPSKSKVNEFGPNVLIILEDSFNLKERLDSIIVQVLANPDGWIGSGELPRSVFEAEEFVIHSTHMRGRIFHCIEYRDYYILSDYVPNECKEWLIIGDPLVPNKSRVFSSGFVVKKGEKIIHAFQLPKRK
jgi:hypothetical protein